MKNLRCFLLFMSILAALGARADIRGFVIPGVSFNIPIVLPAGLPAVVSHSQTLNLLEVSLGVFKL